MDRTVDVLTTNVNAAMVGTVNCVIRSSVIQDVTSTVNAKMEHVCASLDGMENIVRSKVVQEGKSNFFVRSLNNIKLMKHVSLKLLKSWTMSRGWRRSLRVSMQ